MCNKYWIKIGILHLIQIGLEWSWPQFLLCVVLNFLAVLITNGKSWWFKLTLYFLFLSLEPGISFGALFHYYPYLEVEGEGSNHWQKQTLSGMEGEGKFWRPLGQLWPELLTRFYQPKGSQEVQSYPVPRKNVDLGGDGRLGGEVGMVSEDQNFSQTAIMIIHYFSLKYISFSERLILKHCDKFWQYF